MSPSTRSRLAWGLLGLVIVAIVFGSLRPQPSGRTPETSSLGQDRDGLAGGQAPAGRAQPPARHA